MADTELKNLQSFLMAYYPLCLEDYNRYRSFFDAPTSPAANGPLGTRVSLEEVMTSDSNSDGEFTEVISKKSQKMKIQQGTSSAGSCSSPSPAETKPPRPAAEQTCDSAPPAPGRLQESLKASPAAASDESTDVTHSAGPSILPPPAKLSQATFPAHAAKQICQTAVHSTSGSHMSPEAGLPPVSEESKDATSSGGSYSTPPPVKSALEETHAAKETGRTVAPSTSRPAVRSHVPSSTTGPSPSSKRRQDATSLPGPAPRKKRLPPVIVCDRSAWTQVYRACRDGLVSSPQTELCRDGYIHVKVDNTSDHATAGIHVEVDNTSDHRRLTAFLQERGIDYHSDPLDDELRAFVRIAKEISTEDIKADLVRQGIPVLQVRRMSNRRTKAKFNVVMCVLPRTKKGKAIFRIRKLCGLTDISVEHPRQQVANNKKTNELGAAKKKTAKPQEGPSSLKPSVGCLEHTPAVRASAPAQAPYTSWPCIPKQEPATSSSLVDYHGYNSDSSVASYYLQSDIDFIRQVTPQIQSHDEEIQLLANKLRFGNCFDQVRAIHDHGILVERIRQSYEF